MPPDHDPHQTPPPLAAVDPQLQEFLRRMAAAGAGYPRRDMVSVAEGREITEKVRAQWAVGGPETAKTEDLRIPTRHGDVALRVYTPRKRRLAGAFFYIHGGGFVLFSIATHDRVMREYAERAGIVVVGIDYTRAPEGKFPHSLDECVDAVNWLRANAARFDFDARELFVGGDSAGALLSVGLSITFRDAGVPPVAGMVLNYGGFGFGTDMFMNSPSWLRYGNGEYGLSIHMSVWFRSLYVDPARTDPRLSPLHARLEGLPPSYFVITECDALYDDQIAMVERMRAAGCQVDDKVYPGTIHSFLEAVSISDIAVEAFDDTARWLHARSSKRD
jgi:acetyl esterase